MILTLHRDLHHAHADTNVSKRHLRRYRRIYFFGTSLPQNKGAGWDGGAQQQQQQESAATAAAAAARARGNEINTAMRSNALLTCRLVVF